MLSVQEFNQLNRVLEQHTGIRLAATKKDIMASRISSRLRANGLKSFGRYYQLILTPEGSNELGVFIDKMTTHETYFFREIAQFEFLYNYYKHNKPKRFPIRAWSAAASTGEEAYSLAMVIDDLFYNHPWQIHGTDISKTAVSMANDACYAISTVSKIPKNYKKNYCLKGHGANEGTFTVIKKLKQNCIFSVDNLLEPKSVDYSFDIIFLRNVLIYFDERKQKQILNNVIKRLNHAGLLFLGHSETLKTKRDDLQLLQPCIYKKVVP